MFEVPKTVGMIVENIACSVGLNVSDWIDGNIDSVGEKFGVTVG